MIQYTCVDRNKICQVSSKSIEESENGSKTNESVAKQIIHFYVNVATNSGISLMARTRPKLTEMANVGVYN